MQRASGNVFLPFCQQHTADPKFPTGKINWPQAWPAILAAAYKARINLSAVALYGSPNLSPLGPDGQLPVNGQMFYYFTYSAARGVFVLSEVESMYLPANSRFYAPI